jgi:Zn-dependent protease
VVISGTVNRQQNGRISLAGPAVNLVLALAFLALALALAPFRIAFLTGTVAGLFYNVFGVNALLAAFNLIPIPPLDGSKIWPWSVPVYLVALLLALALVASFLLRLGV